MILGDMAIWKMLEGDASSVVKLSQEALRSFSGEERKWVLVDLARTYLQYGQVSEARTLLLELREKFADDDNLVADLEVDVADVSRQLEQGLMKRIEIPEVLDAELEMPTEYALLQNYPNPFNPTTTISYALPKDGMVAIKIYDALGREVRTLVNEFKSTGRYSVEFDASSLASGMYIYKIVAQPAEGGRNDAFTAVKKMMLVK